MTTRFRFHVKPALLWLFLLCSFNLYSQGSIVMEDKVVTYNLPEDTMLKRLLSESADYTRLSEADQQVAYYLNYARKNPKTFLDKAINVFVASHPEVKSKYIGSLQATFKTLQPLSYIQPDAAISQVAIAHAIDLRIHKLISHQSTNGRSFQDRVAKVVKGCASECIQATVRYNPLEAVLGLLFDFNVPDLGHRKSLLDPKFARAGFGSSIVPNQYSVLVIDFSCQ